MKKFLSIVLSLAMVFTLSTTAFAVETEPVTQSTQAIEVPVLDVPDDLTSSEQVQYVKENGAKGIFIEGACTYALVRSSSDSESCDLIINWAGEMASGFRCKKVEIKSTSILFPKTYDSSGTGTSYKTKNFVASVLASVLASVTYGTYDIPTDVDKVSLHLKDGQVYVLSAAAWCSSLWDNSAIPVD